MTVVALQRRRGARVLAGVAGGVADHLGVGVLRVRIVFVVLAAFGGAGVLAYAALWIFAPASPDETRTDPGERRRGWGLAVLGAGCATSATLVIDGRLAALVVPVGFVVMGAVLVWREAEGGDGSSGSRARALTLARMFSGATLVVVGLSIAVLAQVDVGALRTSLLAVLATLVGVALLTVPFWLRLYRALVAERTARVRTEERAAIASHLHDSVLQTLALIQKHSERPQEVARLARGQERELRAWLFDAPREAVATFATSLATVAAEIEDAYGVAVAPVVVGEATLDPPTSALVEATREAVVNAAKHSGAERIDVFAEVEPERVLVFVRDRGCGFDLAAVPTDRHGLAGSVFQRMDRHGGDARIVSVPGDGTEVRLCVPREVAGV